MSTPHLQSERGTAYPMVHLHAHTELQTAGHNKAQFPPGCLVKLQNSEATTCRNYEKQGQPRHCM